LRAACRLSLSLPLAARVALVVDEQRLLRAPGGRVLDGKHRVGLLHDALAVGVPVEHVHEGRLVQQRRDEVDRRAGVDLPRAELEVRGL